MWDWFGIKKRRRRRARGKAFPGEWVGILEKNFALWEKLSVADREELKGHVLVFLEEKRFEGCGGMEITDEVRVTVAAQACLLLLHRVTDYYPKLTSILIYPEAYVAKGGKFGREEDSVRLGESWTTGSVVLAWRSVEEGGQNGEDGRNVVFHEFAHQLDSLSGRMNGAPVLGKGLKVTERRSRYVSWARVMEEEFEALQVAEKFGKRTVIDKYGSGEPAEFFAVVTEAFFERSEKLLEDHPELYEELKTFYKQDPVVW